MIVLASKKWVWLRVLCTVREFVCVSSVFSRILIFFVKCILGVNAKNFRIYYVKTLKMDRSAIIHLAFPGSQVLHECTVKSWIVNTFLFLYVSGFFTFRFYIRCLHNPVNCVLCLRFMIETAGVSWKTLRISFLIFWPIQILKNTYLGTCI